MGVKFKGYNNNKKQLVIIGGNMNGKDVSSEVSKSLKSLGFSFKKVTGAYEHEKGGQVLEQSFVVPYEDHDQYLTLFSLAMQFDQESILHVDNDRHARLEFIKGFQVLELGTLTPFTGKQFELLRDDLKRNFTHDGNYYWVTI